MASDRKLRIVVLGYIVCGPLGGLAWHHLQYVMGLHLLGHDVYFLEDSNDYPACYDPVRNVCDEDPTYGLVFAERIFRQTGLGNRWAYHDGHMRRWFGPCGARMAELCRSADLVLNLLGSRSVLRSWLMEAPRRVYIDTDPVFTQVSHLTDETARSRAKAHSAFLTFGENFGQTGCSIPDDGFPWAPTRQPVVLEAWPVTPGPANGRYTCVLQWESYAPSEYQGRVFDMKSRSFGPFMDLPRRANGQFELAIGSPTAPRSELERNGWTVRDPRPPTRTPWTYRSFIRRSKAEFAIAKHGYVVTRSGWFSERSANYLASGRPVLVQETGFGDWLNADTGVRSFRTPDEAIAGIEAINGCYEAHSRAAREVAAEFFDYRKVLPSLLERAMS